MRKTRILFTVRHGAFYPVIAGLTLAACSYYDSSLLAPVGAESGADAAEGGPQDASEDPDGASGDAVGDVPSDQSDAGCSRALPPDPPSVVDAGGDISFVVASSSIDFGDKPGGNPLEIGYDLDMRCTCQGEANGCLRESWATEEACDGPGGRDNMTGKFLASLGGLFSGLGSESWSQGTTEGLWSLLVKVSGYNGLPDDDRVKLDWYIPAEFFYFQDGGKDPPKWDGTDAWPIRTTSLVVPGDGVSWDLDKPVYFDDRAYVRDGVLVASVSTAKIHINADYVLEFTGGLLTAKVVNKDGAWVLEDGLVAGRWPLQNILSQISRTQDPVFNLPICTNSPVYPQVKKMICSFADICSGVGTPTTPCNAVSAGLRFSTAPARLGPIVETGPPSVYCAPEVDPAQDSCGAP